MKAVVLLALTAALIVGCSGDCPECATPNAGDVPYASLAHLPLERLLAELDMRGYQPTMPLAPRQVLSNACGYLRRSIQIGEDVERLIQSITVTSSGPVFRLLDELPDRLDRALVRSKLATSASRSALDTLGCRQEN